MEKTRGEWSTQKNARLVQNHKVWVIFKVSEWKVKSVKNTSGLMNAEKILCILWKIKYTRQATHVWPELSRRTIGMTLKVEQFECLENERNLGNGNHYTILIRSMIWWKSYWRNINLTVDSCQRGRAERVEAGIPVKQLLNQIGNELTKAHTGEMDRYKKVKECIEGESIEQGWGARSMERIKQKFRSWF